MQPFFFGPPDRRLFGVYHAPARAEMKDCGVVLCHPMAHEYYNAHRYVMQLAVFLNRAGLAVLRFDYYGTGESAGEYEEASVSQWLDDIGFACEELRSRGCRRLCLAGLRFGATLAALFCTKNRGQTERSPVYSERSAGDALVLWEPLANGTDYLREIAGLHCEVLASVPAQDEYGEHEFLGFEFSNTLRREIAAIDLRGDRLSLGHNVLLMESDAEPSLRPALEAAGSHVSYELTPVSPFWQGRHGVTMPGLAPQRMASWILNSCC
jgi:hypothetical protein